MKKPFDPHIEILHYCEHIMNTHIQVLRYYKKTKTWYWDYPAMAAICYDLSRYKKRSSFSYYPTSSDYQTVAELKNKLLELGEIGMHTTKTGSSNIIGNCAEQHAADLFMKRYRSFHLQNLYFSKALRPRTKQVFDPCENCKYVFPNL